MALRSAKKARASSLLPQNHCPGVLSLCAFEGRRIDGGGVALYIPCMDLLKRLWYIARAQLGAGRQETWQPPATGPERGEQSWRRTGDAVPPPARDPQLAGYYANLELPYGADLETARQSWKRLLKQCHPDLHARDPEKRRLANELSAQLTQAFQELERALKAKEKN